MSPFDLLRMDVRPAVALLLTTQVASEVEYDYYSCYDLGASSQIFPGRWVLSRSGGTAQAVWRRTSLQTQKLPRSALVAGQRARAPKAEQDSRIVHQMRAIVAGPLSRTALCVR
ncbi:hypothetical protein KCU61_g313, partial [Aureobasidium melanogenum]